MNLSPPPSLQSLIVELSILCVLIISGCAIWVRRRTWRIPWDRALTLGVVFDGLAYLLINPATGTHIGLPLYRLTGVAHLRDYLGHLLFISALCLLIWAVACRLAPDGDLEHFMHNIEIPGAVAAASMLASLTMSPSLKQTAHDWFTGKPVPTDFFNTPVDMWLRIYWLSYGGLIIYLIWVLIKLLLVLRQDGRSRVAADMFLAASCWALLSFGALLLKELYFREIPTIWIWVPLCMASGLASFAAAWSWRGRMRSFREDCHLDHPDAVCD